MKDFYDKDLKIGDFVTRTILGYEDTGNLTMLTEGKVLYFIEKVNHRKKRVKLVNTSKNTTRWEYCNKVIKKEPEDLL